MEKIPYIDRSGKEVDFEAKRLKFWLETVPEDVRRIEYDLWKSRRVLLHADIYRSEHKRRFGRFTVKPGYDKEQEKIDWQAFAQSFLMGNERKERFLEIVAEAEKNVPKFLERYSAIPRDKVLLIALAGSSVYGPRRAGEFRSDFDIDVLLDQEKPILNFHVTHDQARADFGQPYEITGTGITDSARGNFTIHWLIYPHYPLVNHIDDGRLREIISDIVSDTRKREPELRKVISNFEAGIEERRIETEREGGIY